MRRRAQALGGVRWILGILSVGRELISGEAKEFGRVDGIGGGVYDTPMGTVASCSYNGQLLCSAVCSRVRGML